MRKSIATAQHVFIRRETTGRFCQSALLLEAGKLYSRYADDTLGNVILHGEDIVDLGIVCFGPDLPPGRGLGQRGGNPNPTAGAANAAVEQVTRVQKPSDLSRGSIRASE